MKLHKGLGFLDVFSVASGAMISSGLFILPAIVFQSTGPAMILAYVLGAMLMVPAMISKAELATAMPKSGGSYFFIHRSLGALFGTFAGFASWFSLSLKSAFALLGIGIILQSLLPGADSNTVKVIAVGATWLFTIINILGVKESGKFQVILVFGLIAILGVNILIQFGQVKQEHFSTITQYGLKEILTVTGMIFISFGGLTKVASIAEEIKLPGKTIPRGMFAAFAVVTALYILTLYVTVGRLSVAEMIGTMTPIAEGAAKGWGQVGYLLISIAAALAFITTGNAGLLASSRIPLAMSEDHLLPEIFGKVSVRFKTPVISILLTSVFMTGAIIFLDLENLVKAASTMMLILFFLVNLSVILMRESKIASYRPTYKANMYPYIHIGGMIAYVLLLIELGETPLLITLAFFGLAFVWYFLYSRSRNSKQSAIIHIAKEIIARNMKSESLSDELRDILLQRDGIIEDPFDTAVINAPLIDLEGEVSKDDLFRKISEVFAARHSLDGEVVRKMFYAREESFSTAILEGLAIPHIVIEGSGLFDIMVIRSKDGIDFEPADGKAISKEPVHIVFAIVGSADQRDTHLKALMAIAQVIQNKDFLNNWKKAKTVEDLRNLILLADRIRKGKI